MAFLGCIASHKKHCCMQQSFCYCNSHDHRFMAGLMAFYRLLLVLQILRAMQQQQWFPFCFSFLMLMRIYDDIKHRLSWTTSVDKKSPGKDTTAPLKIVQSRIIAFSLLAIYESCYWIYLLHISESAHTLSYCEETKRQPDYVSSDYFIHHNRH